MRTITTETEICISTYLKRIGKKIRILNASDFFLAEELLCMIENYQWFVFVGVALFKSIIPCYMFFNLHVFGNIFMCICSQILLRGIYSIKDWKIFFLYMARLL
jgi:hypothetical protein